jgi:hypothetical protein
MRMAVDKFYQYVPATEAPQANDAFQQSPRHQIPTDQEVVETQGVGESLDEAEKRLYEKYVRDMEGVRTQYTNKI